MIYIYIINPFNPHKLSSQVVTIFLILLIRKLNHREVNLPKFTLLVCDRSRIETQVYLASKLVIVHYTIPSNNTVVVCYIYEKDDKNKIIANSY